MLLPLNGNNKISVKVKSKRGLNRRNTFRNWEVNTPRPGGKLYSRTLWGMFPPDKYSLITLNSSLVPQINTLKQLMRDWALLRKRIRRKYNGVEFIWTYGISTHGMLHLHIVARTEFISQQWLLNNWRDLHNSYGVDIRRCNRNAPEDNMNKYREIAKYLRKNLLKVLALLKRNRRQRNKFTARLWGMSDGWIKHRKWRTDMKALVKNRGFKWVFKTPSGRKAWGNILLDKESVETYLLSNRS